MKSPAQRKRESRARRKEGKRVLRVEIGIDVVEVLIETGYLEPESIHDLNIVSTAVSEFLDNAADSVSCDLITIYEW